MQELKYNEPWIMQRADPYIYKHESGMYSFTASGPADDKSIVRESDTLEGLADATEHEIWHKHDTGIMGNYFCSNLAGTLISLFSGICLTISVYSYFKSC